MEGIGKVGFSCKDNAGSNLCQGAMQLRKVKTEKKIWKRVATAEISRSVPQVPFSSILSRCLEKKTLPNTLMKSSKYERIILQHLSWWYNFNFN